MADQKQLDLLQQGLETIIHDGPSTIGTDTISRSEGDIPEVFLRCAEVCCQWKQAGTLNVSKNPKNFSPICYEVACKAHERSLSE
jgi:hypothetical protein